MCVCVCVCMCVLFFFFSVSVCDDVKQSGKDSLTILKVSSFSFFFFFAITFFRSSKMYPSNAMTGKEDGTEFRCRDPWCVREAMEPLHVLSASGMQPLKKSELSVKRYIQLRYPQNNNEKKIGAKTLLAHVRP